MFPLANGESMARLRRRLVKDEYSQQMTKADWSNPDRLEVEGAGIMPSTSQETATTNRTTVTTQMALYCESGLDIKPLDRIQARSGLWEVEGEVLDNVSGFTGWSPGSEFKVKRVTG